MKTKNLTLKIDEKTYSKARVRAARKGTSISAMVREFLQKETMESSDPEAARIASLKALYRKADRSARNHPPLKPLNRDEIYAERLHRH